MKRAIYFFSLILVLGLAQQAVGEKSEFTLYAGGFLGDSFILRTPVLFQRVDAVLDDRITGGARYAYFFNPYVAGEVGIGYTPSKIVGVTTFDGTNQTSIIHVDTYVFDANLTAHLVRGPVIPYATLGVGALHFHVRTSRFGFDTPSETDFTWNVGGGIKIPVQRNAAIRLDGRVYFSNPNFALNKRNRFGEFTGGVSFLF